VVAASVDSGGSLARIRATWCRVHTPYSTLLRRTEVFRDKLLLLNLAGRLFIGLQFFMENLTSVSSLFVLQVRFYA
jgi:hypothetical protein